MLQRTYTDGFRFSLPLTLLLLMCCRNSSGTDPSFSSETPQAGPMISSGINMDASVQGTDVKYRHRPEYFDAVRDAGFGSVRFFIDPSAGPAHWEGMIREALERGLVAVPVLWANGGWNPAEFAAYWEAFALYYKDYPNDKLVFEVLNEPDASDLKDKERAMALINAAIPVIRRSNPDRLLAIGGPGFNEAENLAQYVTPEYLDYRLEDGSGFADDKNIVGVFHMYLPYYFSHYHGSRLKDDWRGIVSGKLEEAAAWSAEWGKPALLTEWGAWGPPCNFDEDFYAYLGHIVDETARLGIEWFYYCGFMNNQWAFSIFNTDTGWDQRALDILTGTTAGPPPSLSPLLNAEFDAGTRQWKPRGAAKISATSGAGLSGDRALEIEFGEEGAAVYQEDLGDELGRVEWSECGRSLISLTQGVPYRISFMAKALDGPAALRIGLEHGPTDKAIWTSEAVALSGEAATHALSYTPSEDIGHVRFVILSDSGRQKLYIDGIELQKGP